MWLGWCLLAFSNALKVQALTLPPHQNPEREGPPQQTYLLPSQDPWFSGPPGWESTAPGTVLRVRRHAIMPTTRIRHYNDTFQALFRSTDSHGQPLFAATSVFVPESHTACLGRMGTSGNCSHGLLSYH